MTNFKFQISNSEKGVSLIITFLVMTIVLSMVLNLSAILFNEARIISSIGNYISAFYAADTGIEKTLYFDRKQVPEFGFRGFCNICDSSNGDYTACGFTSGSDCGDTTCTDCTLQYTSTISGDSNKTYTVTASITQVSGQSALKVDSRGLYKEITRQIQLNYTTP